MNKCILCEKENNLIYVKFLNDYVHAECVNEWLRTEYPDLYKILNQWLN